MTDLVGVEKLAEICNVTRKTVQEWISAGMPVYKLGTPGGGKVRDKTKIKLRAAVKWYFAENHERLELDRQRTRLAEEQTDRLALENAERRGEVGEWEVWQRHLEAFLGEMRSALLAIPTQEAPRLNGDVNQRKDRLDKAIHGVLEGLAAYRFEAAKQGGKGTDRGLGDDSTAATKVNGKRMGRSRKAA